MDADRPIYRKLGATGERVARLVRLAATNPQTVKYLGMEAFWTVHRRPGKSLPLSWPLQDPKISGARVHWPHPVPLPDAVWWEKKLRAAFATHVRVEPAKIDHPFTSILMFQVVSRGHTHRIALDYRDSNVVSDECAASVDLYFKLQFSCRGYTFDHIVPGGYLVGSQKFYRYLPELRRLRKRDPAVDVYGRFGPRGESLRREVVQRLTAQDRFSFTGGMGTVLYSQSLAEASQSKVSIDLPGHGWFCYRLAEYLAVGSCVVAVPHRNRLHVELENGKHLAYMQPDGADVVDVCTYYLENDSEREQLMANAQDYFDRYLHYRQLGAYYLDTIARRLL